MGLLLIFSPISEPRAEQGTEGIVNPHIKTEVRFFYDKEPELKERVLYFEQSFTNVSDKTIIFSTYGEWPGIISAEPESAVSLEFGSPRSTGALPQPKVADLIRLAPKESLKVRRWYWPDGLLPFPLFPQQGEFLQNFRVQKKKVKLTLKLTQALNSDEKLFKDLLNKGDKMENGLLEIAPVTFQYEITKAAAE